MMGKNVFCRKSYFVVSCLLLLLGSGTSVFGQEISSDTEAMLIWGKMGKSVYDIYFSSRTRARWSQPSQLSSSENDEILPAVAFNRKGQAWAVWSEIENGDSRLRFCRYSDGQWGSSKLLPTRTSSDLSASIAIDKNRDVWLVFSGTDASDDDIYYARWVEEKWTAPQRINQDDDWPDVLPQLSLNGDGLPRVVWSGFDGEKYIDYASDWDGSSWSPEYSLTTAGSARSADFSKELPVTLPDFLSDRSQAFLYKRDGNKGQSWRFRYK